MWDARPFASTFSDKNTVSKDDNNKIVWLGSDRAHTKWKFCRRTGNKTCTVQITKKKKKYLQKYESQGQWQISFHTTYKMKYNRTTDSTSNCILRIQWKI